MAQLVAMCWPDRFKFGCDSEMDRVNRELNSFISQSVAVETPGWIIWAEPDPHRPEPCSTATPSGNKWSRMLLVSGFQTLKMPDEETRGPADITIKVNILLWKVKNREIG